MKFLPRIRFLPVTIFFAALLLTVRAGDVWRDIVDILEGVSVADATAQQQAPPPAPASGATVAVPPAAPAADAEAEGPAEGEAAARPRDATRGRPMRKLGDDPALLTQAEMDLLQQLAERRDRVEKREQEIEVRSAILKAAETRIDKKVEEMKNLQATIEKLLAAYDEQQEKKVASLVKIYESMKPKEAARIFEELEMDVLLMVVERINSRRLAPILASMNPQKAREVTVELSRLRQLPDGGLGAGG
jgi:flagellar motility protein MotE (MotC chaperone)